ncbi:unnamed protein product [Rotaria socialis]|uniref:Uncharacterized protein n=1 Tax=Rotaria socialis TaxID=392032 RepID=A0A818KAM6_9BILA|nr:unnamed protein product [Rotaria socialis]
MTEAIEIMTSGKTDNLWRKSLGTNCFSQQELNVEANHIKRKYVYTCAKNQNEQAANGPLSAIFRNCFLIDENIACTDFMAILFSCCCILRFNWSIVLTLQSPP